MQAIDCPTSKTVFLHVGAPKTGTTFLQQVLWNNRATLATNGVLYPLQRPFEHFGATMDLRRMAWGGVRRPEWNGAWDRVAGRAREWTGPKVVISNELLGGATEQQAQRAVGSLGQAEVHVVLTARDLARQLPSGWQEHLKHQHTVGFDEFLDDVLGLGVEGWFGRRFWRIHDVQAVLRRWDAAVPPHRVHVVTVPPPDGPEGLLWARFARLVGVDAADCDTEIEPSNPSIGAAEAQLLRRVNQALDGRLPHPRYDPVVRIRLAEDILARRPHKRKVAVPRERYPRILELSEAMVEGIRAAGYDVVGDLEELMPMPPEDDDGSTRPDDVAFTEVLDAAVDAIAGLALDMGKRREQEPSGTVAARDPQPSALKRVVRDLSGRHPWLMRARRIYWRTADRLRRAR